MTTTLLAEPVTTPAPGVYENVPFHVYHSWDCASNSRLTKLDRSPAHLRAYLDEPQPEKEHFAVGRAIHCALLESCDFTNTYVAAPDNINLRTNAGKEAWGALELEYGPGHVFKADAYGDLVRMRDAVLRHPAARGLLVGDGRVELSVVWVDRDTGILCKSRFDKHSPAMPGGALVDLKSTTDARPDEFARAIAKWGYHRQGALYLEGADAAGIEARWFVNIAFEKSSPFAVGAYCLDEPTITRGANQLKRLKARYAECLATNEWPAYAPTVVDLGLPEWTARQIDEETDHDTEATP
jgi:hypothetical protein